MLRCSKADFEEVDFFVWKPYLHMKMPPVEIQSVLVVRGLQTALLH